MGWCSGSNLISYAAVAGFLWYMKNFLTLAWGFYNPEVCATDGSQACFGPLTDTSAKWEVRVYVSQQWQVQKPQSLIRWEEEGQTDGRLVWHIGGKGDEPLRTGDSRTLDTKINGTDWGLDRNGTIYAHITAYRRGYKPGFIGPSRRARKAKKGKADPATIYNVHALSHHALPKYNTTNLVSGEKLIQQERIPLTHWRENLTMHFVDDYTVFPQQAIPPDFYADFRMHPPIDGKYRPVLYVGDLYHLQKYAQPMTPEAATKKLSLRLSLTPISLGWWRVYRHIENACGQMMVQWDMGFEDIDQLKALFVDTAPVLLFATFLVSILHSLFSFLAMKNDVLYWNGKENTAGISWRATVFDCVAQFVIMLYLYDTDQVNKLVMILLFCESVLAVWKLVKVLQMPTAATKSEKISDEADRKAFKLLMLPLMPVCAGYAVYSFYYDEHKGYYSFALQTMASLIYTLGFIKMTPQLFINYKLKSVESVPWRTLCYRSFNTFVDDLFSFVIDMPLMHRLACFRDDIVFFVFLYQWYLYGAQVRKKESEGGNNSPEPKEETAKKVD